MKALILSVFVLCFLALGSCTHVKFMPCPDVDASAKLVFVDVDPCTKQPCELKKGTEETMQVQFIPSSNITTAKTIVHGKVGPLWVKFPLDNDDACKGEGYTCPLIAGQTYTFKAVLPIKSMYPSIQVIVKWEMHDQDDKPVYCWEIPARIVS